MERHLGMFGTGGHRRPRCTAPAGLRCTGGMEVPRTRGSRCQTLVGLHAHVHGTDPCECPRSIRGCDLVGASHADGVGPRRMASALPSNSNLVPRRPTLLRQCGFATLEFTLRCLDYQSYSKHSHNPGGVAYDNRRNKRSLACPGKILDRQRQPRAVLSKRGLGTPMANQNSPPRSAIPHVRLFLVLRHVHLARDGFAHSTGTKGDRLHRLHSTHYSIRAGWFGP